MAGNAKWVELHTPEEVATEVEALRADDDELRRLMSLGILRPYKFCFEEDLRTEAYNRLTERKGLYGRHA